MKGPFESERKSPGRDGRGRSGALLLPGALAIIAAAAVSPAARLRADWIELASGNRIENAEIVQARHDGLQYKQGNKPPLTLQAGQVSEISRESAVLQRLRQQIDAGQVDAAKEALGTLTTQPDWVQAEGAYRVAEGYLDRGKAKEAAVAFKEYLDKHKGSKDWFVPHATLGLARALLAARQPSTAEIHFKELAQFGGAWALHGQMGQADAILQARGAAGALDARRLYDQAGRSRDATPEVRQRAAVGRARAFLLANQPQEAIKELSSAMFDNPKPEDLRYTSARAEASLIMGQAYIALGGKANLEQAEIWFLRVPALYGKHADAYAEACDALVGLYGKMNDAARANEWKARKEAGAR